MTTRLDLVLVPREPTTEMIEAGDFDLDGPFTPNNSVMATIQVYKRMIASAPSQEVGWRTIDSAPKDGTEIIGLHFTDWGDDTKPSVYGPWTVAFDGKEWRSSWDGQRVVDYMSDFGIDYKEPDLQPTHWMPLPPTDSIRSLKKRDGSEKV